MVEVVALYRVASRYIAISRVVKRKIAVGRIHLATVAL